MSPFFRRRSRSGPNKNEQKVLRGKEAANRTRLAGLLGQRYPSVERLSVQLDFISPQGHSIDHQTRIFWPSDTCDFSVPCPGRCSGGSYDLAAKIRPVVEGRETLSESSGLCQEPLYGGSPDTCGFRLKCRIEVRYLPQPA